MDREQFDGAQNRLRKLAPEGKEVSDNFRFVNALVGNDMLLTRSSFPWLGFFLYVSVQEGSRPVDDQIHSTVGTSHEYSCGDGGGGGGVAA